MIHGISLLPVRVYVKLIFLSLLLALCGPSMSQVNKCKGPSGKVIYSDVACAAPEEMQRVKINQNTIDASGDRRSAQGMRENAEREAMMIDTPDECRFEGASGKRLELARLAKEECISNIIAERMGQKSSTTARQAYKENEEHRRRLIEAAAASGGRRNITCMGMGPGMMACK